jgi:hypothetical protein
VQFRGKSQITSTGPTSLQVAGVLYAGLAGMQPVLQVQQLTLGVRQDGAGPCRAPSRLHGFTLPGVQAGTSFPLGALQFYICKRVLLGSRVQKENYLGKMWLRAEIPVCLGFRSGTRRAQDDRGQPAWVNVAMPLLALSGGCVVTKFTCSFVRIVQDGYPLHLTSPGQIPRLADKVTQVSWAEEHKTSG